MDKGSFVIDRTSLRFASTLLLVGQLLYIVVTSGPFVAAPIKALAGFDRDRASSPTCKIVIASYREGPSPHVTRSARIGSTLIARRAGK